ncbi:MAG: hypothetical protein PHP46_02820 [Candidatus Omnitrophica bacterium]|nr:hypothetical protein [Candidatus Omnitrophota bacterium]
MNWLTVVVADPVKAMVIKIGSYIPTLLGAIAILIIGWMIAKLLETMVTKVLRTVKLDMASDKAGITNILAQGDIKMTLSELFGAIVYWVVVLISFVTALNALNLTIAADLLSRLVEYVPNIISAIFVLVLGSFLAGFMGAIVRTSMSNAGLGNAKLLGKITQVILIIFATIIAIQQLNVATALIALAVNVVLASIGIGIALAFGLGCKDIAGKYVSDLINQLKK